MKYVIVLSLLFICGCTSLDVHPIPASAKVDKICIKYNEQVNVDDFVPVMQEDFSNHGIRSVVFKSDKPDGCEFSLSYTVNRAWDMAPYMVDAQMIINRNGEFIGSAHYHLNGRGGFDLAKWAGTHSKIDPAIDQMLRDYPKVDFGAASKSTAK